MSADESLLRLIRCSHLLQCSVHLEGETTRMTQVFHGDGIDAIAHASEKCSSGRVIAATNTPVRQFENQARVPAHVVHDIGTDSGLRRKNIGT